MKGIAKEKKFYYFYKITNTVNGNFYFGVHATDDLEDGYMGSGYRLQEAYNKYGLRNFKKEILKFFENRDEMMNYEAQIVNSEMVKNPMCYNLVNGGWGPLIMK